MDWLDGYVLRSVAAPTLGLPELLGGCRNYVWLGDRAYRQRQIGSLGYVAECMWVALEHGVRWRLEYGSLLGRMRAPARDMLGSASSSGSEGHIASPAGAD